MSSTQNSFYEVDSFPLGKHHEIKVSMLPQNVKYSNRACSLAKIFTSDNGTSFAKEHMTVSVDQIDRLIQALEKAKNVASALAAPVPT